MKYLIPRGTKIRRVRWTGQLEEFYTTKEVEYGQSDVVMVGQTEIYMEFMIPLPWDDVAIVVPRKVSPYKSIKVMKDRIHYLPEDAPEATKMLNALSDS